MFIQTESSQIAEAQPLHILIAGAGIGGLSAAIALRQSGHKVEVRTNSSGQLGSTRVDVIDF